MTALCHIENMVEYFSTFPAGFEKVVGGLIKSILPTSRVIKSDGGAVHYAVNKPLDPTRLPFASNTFRVIKKFRDVADFGEMADGMAALSFTSAAARGSFRVRFSRESEFVGVSPHIMQTAERAVIKSCGLRLDRNKPDTEFWFIIRRGGTAFFTELMKHGSADKPGKGELRPELAYLLCVYAGIRRGDVVCDPFAGHGAVPKALTRFPCKKIYVSDNEPVLVTVMQKSSLKKDARVEITFRDAADLSHIGEKTVDRIITDPPWGFFGEINDLADLYFRVFVEFRRILRDNGCIALLAGKPAESAEAAISAEFKLIDEFPVLVNGKKASVIMLNKLRPVILQ